MFFSTCLILCCAALAAAHSPAFVQLPSVGCRSVSPSTSAAFRARVALFSMCEAAAEAPPADEPAAEAPAPAPAAEAAPARKAPRKRPGLPLSEMVEGAQVEGTVKNIMSYGAFVDVGCQSDGLLHISDLGAGFVTTVDEVVKQGDKVTVTIKGINIEKNQLSLTMRKPGDEPPPRKAPGGRAARPDLSKWAAMDAQTVMTGTVSSVASYGCFVTLEEGVDGLVHISEVSEGRINSVEEVVTVGQEVQVRVVSTDKAKGRIGLSMKAYVEPEPEVNVKAMLADADQPVFKSVLEIAIEQAEAKLTTK